MNGIVRTVLRTPLIRNFLSTTANNPRMKTELTRTLSNMCSRQNIKYSFTICNKLHHHSDMCGCSFHKNSHTKAGKELVEFLAEEIVAEKKAQKFKTIPSELEGFKVSLNGAEVTLSKTEQDERIEIHFNINHTVDADSEPDLEPQDDKVDMGEMKSKPSFSIDIVRGNQTLGFSCSFNNEPGASGADDSYNDLFGIDEITLYEGEHNDKVYAVAGEIIDGYLYDLLMNYLEEKGISNEFAEKLVELSTNYEHTAYISLLEGLSKFTSK